MNNEKLDITVDEFEKIFISAFEDTGAYMYFTVDSILEGTLCYYDFNQLYDFLINFTLEDGSYLSLDELHYVLQDAFYAIYYLGAEDKGCTNRADLEGQALALMENFIVNSDIEDKVKEYR